MILRCNCWSQLHQKILSEAFHLVFAWVKLAVIFPRPVIFQGLNHTIIEVLLENEKIVHFKGSIVHFGVPMLLQISINVRWLNIWLYPYSISFTRLINLHKDLQYIDVKSLWTQTYWTCYDTAKLLATKNAIEWSTSVLSSAGFCLLLSGMIPCPLSWVNTMPWGAVQPVRWGS